MVGESMDIKIEGKDGCGMSSFRTPEPRQTFCAERALLINAPARRSRPVLAEEQRYTDIETTAMFAYKGWRGHEYICVCVYV